MVVTWTSLGAVDTGRNKQLLDSLQRLPVGSVDKCMWYLKEKEMSRGLQRVELPPTELGSWKEQGVGTKAERRLGVQPEPIGGPFQE